MLFALGMFRVEDHHLHVGQELVEFFQLLLAQRSGISAWLDCFCKADYIWFQRLNSSGSRVLVHLNKVEMLVLILCVPQTATIKARALT